MAISHLREGDVVFTVDASGTPMHMVIATAQRVGSPFQKGHANSVHAAIATGNGSVVYESVGSGLRRKALDPGNYRVYCYRGIHKQGIRKNAVLAAESFVANAQTTPGYGAYNKRKATLSVIRKKRQGPTQQFGAGAKAHSRFFCSNMVWRAFMAAAEMEGLVYPNALGMPMPWAHSQLSPRDLEAMLIKSPYWHGRNGGHSMSHP